MLFPNWFVIWLAVAGISAFILGQRSAATLLLAPAIVRFAVLPLLPSVPEGGTRIALAAAIPIVAVFGAILLLKKSIGAVYGRQAAGHVAGTYLVRVFDRLGGLLALVVLAGLVGWIWSLL